jgi:cytoskeleton protein RodZ
VEDLGARLRAAREEQGISLREAEQATRIRGAFLEAIEEGRLSDLPGEVYARGFIRNYARFLGLDPDAMLQEHAITSHQPVHVAEILDEPLTPLSHRLFGWVLALLFVGLVSGGVWYLYNYGWVRQGWRVQSFWPPTISTPTAPALAIPDPTGTPPTTRQTPVSAAEVTPIPSVGDTELVPTETATPTATPTPRPPTATPSPTPTPIPGVQIEAFAQADTYLEVRADGELLGIGILRATETSEWRADELIQLRIGNAGGLQLLVNGRDVGSLGASGQVINVEYRIDDLP